MSVYASCAGRRGKRSCETPEPNTFLLPRPGPEDRPRAHETGWKVSRPSAGPGGAGAGRDRGRPRGAGQGSRQRGTPRPELEPRRREGRRPDTHAGPGTPASRRRRRRRAWRTRYHGNGGAWPRPCHAGRGGAGWALLGHRRRAAASAAWDPAAAPRLSQPRLAGGGRWAVEPRGGPGSRGLSPLRPPALPAGMTSACRLLGKVLCPVLGGRKGSQTLRPLPRLAL